MVEWHHTTTPTGWQFTTYEPDGKVDYGTTGRTGKPQPYDQLHQRLHRERHLAIRIPERIVFVDNDTHKHPEQDTPLTQQLWADLRQSPTWTIGVRGIEDATRMYRLPIGAEWQPGDTTQWAGGELLAWWHRWQAIGHHMTTKGQEAYKVRYDGIDPPSVDYGWPDLNALPRLPGGLWKHLLRSAITDLDQHGDSGGWEEGRPPGPAGDMFAHALTQLPTIQSILGGRQVGTRQHDGNTLTDYQHAKATHRRSYSIANPGQPNERVRFFSPNVIGADFDDSGSATYDRLDIQCLKQHGRTDPNIRTEIARQHSPTTPPTTPTPTGHQPPPTDLLIHPQDKPTITHLANIPYLTWQPNGRNEVDLLSNVQKRLTRETLLHMLNLDSGHGWENDGTIRLWTPDMELPTGGDPITIPNLENVPLVRGEMCLLFGHSSAGKTTLSLDWARRIGHDNKRVAILALERPWLTQQTIKQWPTIQGKNAQIVVADRAPTATLAGTQPNPEWLKWATQLADQHNPDLLIIDTLDQWSGGPRNFDYTPINALEALRPLTQTGTAILLIGHTGHPGGKGDDPTKGARLAGSAKWKDLMTLIYHYRSRKPGDPHRLDSEPPGGKWHDHYGTPPTYDIALDEQQSPLYAIAENAPEKPPTITYISPSEDTTEMTRAQIVTLNKWEDTTRFTLATKCNEWAKHLGWTEKTYKGKPSIYHRPLTQ